MIGKWAVIVLSLGLDNLAASSALGAAGVKNKLRLCIVFALFEAFMPALGFLIGETAGRWIGMWGYYAGLAVMAGIGVYMLFEDDDKDEDERKRRLSSDLKGWALLGSGLAVSLDELAAGIGFGLLEFPVVWTLALMGVQAFFFTWVGLTFGSKLRPFLGEAAEKAAGILLIAAAFILLTLQMR